MQLNLEQAEVQVILNALANRPYGEVYMLVQKVVAQANEQAKQGGEATDGQAGQ